MYFLSSLCLSLFSGGTKCQQTWQFSRPTHPDICWRNIWMVPNTETPPNCGKYYQTPTWVCNFTIGHEILCKCVGFCCCCFLLKKIISCSYLAKHQQSWGKCHPGKHSRNENWSWRKNIKVFLLYLRKFKVIKDLLKCLITLLFANCNLSKS